MQDAKMQKMQRPTDKVLEYLHSHQTSNSNHVFNLSSNLPRLGHVFALLPSDSNNEGPSSGTGGEVAVVSMAKMLVRMRSFQFDQ